MDADKRSRTDPPGDKGYFPPKRRVSSTVLTNQRVSSRPWFPSEYSSERELSVFVYFAADMLVDLEECGLSWTQCAVTLRALLEDLREWDGDDAELHQRLFTLREYVLTIYRLNDSADPWTALGVRRTK